MCLHDVSIAGAITFDGDQFQSGQRAHHHGALQLRHDALVTRLVTAHLQIVRAHIGKGFGVLGLAVLGAGQTHRLVVHGDVHFALVGAAMEQIHIAQKSIHKGTGRVFPHVLWRTHLFDFSFVHHHHPIGHFQGFFLVVGDENRGHVQVVVQAAQPAAQLFAHLGVQGTKRLVEQQHFGFDRQGAGQGNALALPTREL